MTLGSLFDGSGGFPLAGMINGIQPVWASEVEAYPIRVTSARIPCMKHLGDVTKINGAEIEPVDVITFGSPCQDLSIAGAQKGIHEGERSSLFFEAVRIIKEMRTSDRADGRTDEHVRPRFAVWENVPGAFSSNAGRDFQAVLQALCGVCDEAVSVPEPPKGKWAGAGCIVGEGYSVAWRVYDAQYWGVPQRRKRIYLIADFASERAGEILFEREGVQGDSAEGVQAREEPAVHAAGSAGGSGCDGAVAFHLQQDPIYGSTSPCIGGQHQATVGVFLGGQGAKAGGIGYSERISPTLKSVPSGINQAPDVVYPNIARTLTAEHDSSPCADRGQNVVVHAAGFNDSVGERAQGGMEYTEERSPMLRSGDVRAVVYDARGNGAGGVSPTMTGDHQNRVTDYTVLVCAGFKAGQSKAGGIGWQEECAATLSAKCSGTEPTVCVKAFDQQRIGQYGNGEVASTLMARDYKDAKDLVVERRPARKYIVRRLTPLECCRLQGFPDWWEDGVEGSDSARYKMWGNGIALPCAVDVLRRIAKAMEDTNGHQTD